MKSYRKQHQQHKRLLKEEIQEVIKRRTNLCKEAKEKEKELSSSTTWMKFMIIKVSINRLLDKEALKEKTQQSKTLYALILEKQKME